MIKRRHKRIIKMMVRQGCTNAYILAALYYHGTQYSMLELENYINEYRNRA